MKVLLNILLLCITALSFLIFTSQAIKDYNNRDTGACILALISWVVSIILNIVVQMYL